MPEALWIALPFTAALGAGVLSFIVARAWMQASVARNREELVEARAQLTQQQKILEERVRATRAEARRQAFDDFLKDVRIEERHYLREVSSREERRKCLVLQERVCFRNIPLSQWTERELPFGREISLEELRPQPVPIVLAPVPPRRRLIR